MRVLLKVYDGSKYMPESKNVKECELTIKDFVVKTMSDDEVRGLGFDEFDPENEYLILTFEDGTTSTYRNSYVDMFNIG